MRCSFPIRSDEDGWRIVQEISINDFSRAKIDATVKELQEERALMAELLPK